ncbi:REP-associated tyrosine transposase [Desulfoluna butyratoxydans]|uniref:Transposase is200-like n=1 Tax=Desulfoluna butyratoxydans TaxID=231438 RepID=A0A4U8YM73_9BACT|nr:transposase [Desulfoluna butyratoxydans]VFQ44790.1 transposase is200-like [Desulfoluna butyratoxydans]
MPNYRRVSTAGASFFFTVVTHHRQPVLCDEPVRVALRNSIERVRAVAPFSIDAWVLLPDHLHCIWTLPEGDADYSSRWSRIKRYVTTCCGDRLSREGFSTESRKARQEGTLWQRRFWEHRIRDERDFETHMDYIHYNPVKHGVVERVGDWPWSTFHRLVVHGVYDGDWGGCGEVSGNFGEW